MMESGQWKRARIVVILPASNTMSTKGRALALESDLPAEQRCQPHPRGGHGSGRGVLAGDRTGACAPELSQWEYVLSIEHDNTPPPDGVLKLLETMDRRPEYAAVSGLYWTKGGRRPADLG